ncbi:MAG: hypothetical protein AAGC88_09045, partial [Bacteroidota bacterium]
MIKLAAQILLFTLFGHFAVAQPVKLHAHNDYRHKVPFWTAFTQGFESIEVDLILRDGELYVAHDPHEIQDHRTLQSLYLDPLQIAVSSGSACTSDYEFP